jgi:hypothetical protein
VIDGMGHDLPRPLWPTVADRIAALVTRTAATKIHKHLGDLDIEASKWTHGPSVLFPWACP